MEVMNRILSQVERVQQLFLNRYASIILLAILVFTTSQLYAETGTLSGIVKMTDGQAVSFAAVIISQPKNHTITDENGKFTFRNLSHGTYEVTISSLEVSTKTIKLDFNSSKNFFEITVEPSQGIDLQETTISVKSTKKELETQGFAVNVIETHLASLQSVQTNELLDRSAGVRIRQEGGLGSRINYNLNGMSGNAVKIFINGVPASNFGPAFSLNSIPPALIDRIEVYKGVVPAHLSDDALGGAINVVLKNKTKNSLVTSYSGGSFNTHQWNATGTYRFDKGLTIGASGFFNYSDNSYKVWGKDISFKDYTGRIYPNQRVRRFHDAYMSYGAKAEIGFTDVKWADRFMIGGIFSKDYKEIQHGITMAMVYGDRHTRRTSNVVTLNYAKDNLFVNGLSFKIDASYSDIKRQVIDTVGNMYDWSGKPIKDPEGNIIKYTSGAEVASQKTLAINSDNTYMTRMNLGYKIKENNRFNFNYLHNTFIRGISDELQDASLQNLQNTRDLQKNILSLSYENIAFRNKVRTNVFYKHYFQKAISNEPYKKGTEQGKPIYDVNVLHQKVNYSGYGATVSYEAIPNLYFMTSYEKAIRLPSPDELFGNVNENVLAPTNGLKPETSHNFNLGINWSKQFKKHFVKANTSAFYRSTSGMIREAIRTGSTTYSSFENLEKVLSTGVDVEMSYKFADQLHVSLNISKFASLFNTQYDQYGAPYLYYRTQIRNEPSFKYNFSTSYTFHNLFAKKARASIQYNMNYVQKFYRNWANIGAKNLDYIPTQLTHDIGISYTIPNNMVTVSFDAKNISNEQVFDNFGLQKPGRAFYAKVTFSLYSK